MSQASAMLIGLRPVWFLLQISKGNEEKGASNKIRRKATCYWRLIGHVGKAAVFFFGGGGKQVTLGLWGVVAQSATPPGTASKGRNCSV